MARHASLDDESFAVPSAPSGASSIDHVLDAVRRRAAERKLAFNLELWNGRRETFGSAPRVTLRVNRAKAALRLLKPDLGSLGEAYVEGDIDLEGPAAEIVRLGLEFARGAPERRLAPWLNWRPGRHGVASDARAIAHHYDVSNDFYRLWLDRAMVYSCAFFRDGDEDLDRAQEQKLDLICRKLRLAPGEALLDIGCGWGSLVIWAAKHYRVKATGVTISRQQFEHVQQRLAAEGLAGQVEVRLQDYREIPGREVFDKIASVGMFEHVGLKNLPTYFAHDPPPAEERRPGAEPRHHDAQFDRRRCALGRRRLHRALRLSRRRTRRRRARDDRDGAAESRGLRRRGPAATLCADADALGDTARAAPRRGAGAWSARSATASGASTWPAARWPSSAAGSRSTSCWPPSTPGRDCRRSRGTAATCSTARSPARSRPQFRNGPRAEAGTADRASVPALDLVLEIGGSAPCCHCSIVG